MKFGRILAACALFASFFSLAHACALCSLYTPTAHTQIQFNSEGEMIRSATITWTFSENFTNLTLQSYDEDADKALNKNEAWKVQKSILDYIVPRGYLTNVSFYDGMEETKILYAKTLSQRVFLEDGRLNFEYILELNLEAKDDRVIVFEIFDHEGFFNFKISSEEHFALDNGIYVMPNVNLYTVFFQMSARAPKPGPQKPELSSLIKSQKERNLEQIDAEDKAKFDSLSVMSLKFLERLKELIKINSTELNALNFALLAAVSFFYGFLHAAGPGHAKMLTASYFVANGGSYSRAFVFAMKVGFAHVAGAFLLVFFSYVFLNAFLTNKVSDIAGAMTKISAVVIICVSLYMLYAKIKKTALKPKFSFSPAVSAAKGANFTSKIFSQNSVSLGSNLSATELGETAVNLNAKDLETTTANLSLDAENLASASAGNSALATEVNLNSGAAQASNFGSNESNSSPISPSNSASAAESARASNLTSVSQPNLTDASSASNLASDSAVKSAAVSNLASDGAANLASASKSSNSNAKFVKFDPAKAVHSSECSCAACKTSREKPKTAGEWLVVLAGSLVPCPGTLLVFVLAFSLNSYAAGLASGLFMGLGMGAVIFLAAVCGFKLKGAMRFRALRVCCEFAALFVMLGLGVFMFYISGKVSVL